MTERIDQRIIDELRARHSLVDMVGRRVKLSRAGRGWKGLCPFHSERNPSFHVSDEKGSYHCYGCGAHGDLIEWVQEVDGIGFLEAVRRLNAGQLPDARHKIAAAPRERLERPAEVVSSSTAGRWIYKTSGPARGEIVERWLESRGLNPLVEFLPGFAPIDELRFHPRCPVSSWRFDEDPACVRLTAPAMVAPWRDLDGLIWGVHCTYLAPDGRSKAKLPLMRGKERPTRKMFGKMARCAVYLTPPEAMCSEAPLIVGEGIETVWAQAQQRQPCRAAAALSLENLQGRSVRLRDGSLPLWRIESDPEGPPFLIGRAGEVMVLVDADMKPLRDQKVQLSRGAKPVRADISGLQRAEICAALASQAWRRAGADKVTAIRPQMGLDFNDSIRSAA